MKPTSTPVTLVKAGAGLALVTVLGLTACAPDDIAEFSDDDAAEAASADQTPAEDEPDEAPVPGSEEEDLSAEDDNVIVAEVDDPVTFEECEEAEEAEDATVTWLEDVVVEEQHHEGLEPRTIEVDGEEVQIPGAPDVIIPERVGQAGCIIEYEAPANCMAEVEISGAYIPGFTVPERRIPEVELPDGTVLEELVMPAEEAEAQQIDGDHHEQVCQIDEDLAEGDFVSNVSRGNISRGNLSQGNVSQPNVSRGNTSTESGDFISGDFMSGTFTAGMFVPGVFVAGEFMAGYRLEGSDHTERSGEDESVSYTTEGDVLFDSSEYELRSDAESELQAIADDVADRDDDFEVTVEGHTDNVPVDPDQDFADNVELSELRAESVAQWLIDNAGVDADAVTSEGLGEDYPRADNDSDEGRQQNRRVVITVQPEDYESSLDYELEEDQDEG